MLDLTRTLDPASGIAREVRLGRPTDDNPLWTYVVDIGQGDWGSRREQRAKGFDLAWVGASGLTRSATLPRAAGEAVERYALMPLSGLPQGHGLPELRPAPQPDDPPVGTGVTADPGRGRCYRAQLITDGAVQDWVAVSAADIDYPLAAGLAAADDPSPSGAAAGSSADFALSAAARELIERDAAMRAWYGSGPLQRIGRSTLESVGPLRRVLTLADRLDVELVPTLLPSVHPRLRAVLCLAVDSRHGTVSAGIAFEHDEGVAARKAILESFQVRAVLMGHVGTCDEGTDDARPITGDAERAAYWASPRCHHATRGWRDRIVDDAADLRRERVDDWAPFLGPHARLDLTSRLPDPIRDVGWVCFKLVPTELARLRMDETRYSSDPGQAPHPLI